MDFSTRQPPSPMKLYDIPTDKKREVMTLPP